MIDRNATLEAHRITRKGGYVASPRIIWNGGFWDGAYDVRNGQPVRQEGAGERPLPAWSAFYRAGYRAGVDASRDGFRGDDSTASWGAWVAAAKAPEVRRMLANEEGWK